MNRVSQMQLRAFALAGCTALAMCASAAGNDAPAPPAADAGAPVQSAGIAEAAVRDVRASDVIGKAVRNSRGEELGEIEELIVDVTNERVHYAVLSFGGLLGYGAKLFAYPVDMLSLSADRGELVLNVDKALLERTPGFDTGRWPGWNGSAYPSDVRRYFGSTVAIQAQPDQRLVRVSTLIGSEVDDRSGQHAGEIEDLVVNLPTASVRYVALEFDAGWGPDDKTVPVPLAALRYPTDATTDDRRDIVLDVDRKRLDTAQGFDEDDWPDVNDADYRRRVNRYLDSFDVGARPDAGGVWEPHGPSVR
jgi:sporulation protein YlmC with PRC-barrel domain